MSYKNINRRAETLRVREERIISGYVNYQHPEIYKQAKEFYEHLDVLYPYKKDLRRTNEYEMLKDVQSRKMRKYYTRKTVKPKEITDTRKANKPKEITDNMVLRIPLMNEHDTENTIHTVEIPLMNEHDTENTIQTVEIPLMNEGDMVEIPTPQHEITVGTTRETAVETPMTTDPIDLTLIDNEIIDRMIEELREDSGIADFFDNIDYELDDCPLW